MNNRIFTNNPLVAEYISAQPKSAELIFMGIPASELLVAVRTAVREGAVLVSNPLSGVRMDQTRAEKKPLAPKRFGDKTIPFGGKPVAFNPYVSVLVTSAREAVDFLSVKRIEEALTVYKKNAGLRFSGRSDESVKQFQMADMDAMVVTLAENVSHVPVESEGSAPEDTDQQFEDE